MAFRSFQYYLSSWFLAWRVAADCSVYGIDYSNGGSYNIDASSDDYFTFTSVFEGCEQETINPILVAPSGDQYPCSAVTTTPEGEEVTSSCGIAYSSMPSGQWKIIISGTKMAVQRVITLTAGTPETVVITATPTVVIGLTSTPAATTVFSTIGTQTQTLILVPKTITAPCDGPTQTLTITPKAPTVTRTSTIVRTKTDKQTTIHSSTTVTETATCHYPTSGPDSPGPRPTSCIGIGHLCMPSADYLVDKDGSLEAIALVETQVKNNVQAVAASTVTVTETTYTVTTTSLTTLPTPTAIENVFRTVTATITPAPSTVCEGGDSGPTITITRPYATVTQTNIVYSTSHATGTVLVGETKYTVSTNSASATACWRDGGWMGA